MSKIEQKLRGIRKLSSGGQENLYCRACEKPIEKNSDVALIALGPGDSEENMEKCEQGRPYNAVAIQVHWSCATGEKQNETK